MTKINILERRKKSLEQKKNRLKEIEASLNAQERKKRTRRLIELGGLITKANLEDWDSNVLLGAFLSLKEKETDKKQLEHWAHKGGAAFSSEKVKKSPVIVKFDSMPPDEVRSSLKGFGLKWNALRKEWEGYAQVEQLTDYLSPHKAQIQQLEEAA